MKKKYSVGIKNWSLILIIALHYLLRPRRYVGCRQVFHWLGKLLFFNTCYNCYICKQQTYHNTHALRISFISTTPQQSALSEEENNPSIVWFITTFKFISYLVVIRCINVGLRTHQGFHCYKEWWSISSMCWSVI